MARVGESIEEVFMDENTLSLLEQQSPLFADYVKQQSSFFVDYVKSFPELGGQVVTDVTAAFLALELLWGGPNPTFEQVVAGRDGAFRLCGVADGAGFADVGSFFYEAYEALYGHVALY
jgi:hypothetical protein